MPLCSPTADFVSRRINASIARRSLSPDRDRMHATAFRSPATASALTETIPGSTFLACRSASLPTASAARSALRSATDRPVCFPVIGDIDARGPLPLPLPAVPAASPASTPLRDCYIPPDQSVLPDLLQAGPPSELARFPFAPRPRHLFLVTSCGSTFPGSLPFRRLAVPQTSWNLLHYAPDSAIRSIEYRVRRRDFRNFFLLSIEPIAAEEVSKHCE